MKFIVGLGNPGNEYDNTRHNIGRGVLELFRKENKFEDWFEHKKSNSLISEGKIGKDKITLILPETFMNTSGNSVMHFVKNKKQAQNTLVVYDDLDLGIDSQKLSFNKGSGGHKGIESIIKKIKTKEFNRLRLGIAPITPTGKVKKVSGEEKVRKHVLAKFKPSEDSIIKKQKKRASKAITLFIQEGYMLAGNKINNSTDKL